MTHPIALQHASTPFTVEQLLRVLEAASAEQKSFPLHITVHQPGSAGATPSTPVKNAAFGFDWDRGKLLITPETALSLLSQEQLQDITASVKKGQSWHAFESHKSRTAELTELRKCIQTHIGVLSSLLDDDNLSLVQRERISNAILA